MTFWAGFLAGFLSATALLVMAAGVLVLFATAPHDEPGRVHGL